MSNNPESGWPIPAPMSDARFNEISAMVIKWWQRNRARYHRFDLPTALKAVDLTSDEMMEYLELTDREEEVGLPRSTTESSEFRPKVEVDLPHVAHCTSCKANVAPLDLKGIKICPQCMMPLEIG